MKFHEPVLKIEALELLKVKKGKKYLDATVGGAGHAEEVLKKGGTLLGLDCDPQALAFSRKRLVSACPPSACCWKLVKGNFARLKKIARDAGFLPVSGIIFDLGASWFQLKEPGRGFSLRSRISLDMRLDPEIPVSAFDLVNHLSQKELILILRRFGEERRASRIVREIVSSRRNKPIRTGEELAEIIASALPGRKGRIHPATRSFQALRIAVNNELENLSQALPQAVELLETEGRLVVISFHSLEDRIVKNFLRNRQAGGELKILTPKPICASPVEVKNNPGSRSAKLRAAEKTK
ncbi:MAG: 16S rRNA (cytosine(1402)-N(4))-methyltransferase RsmH [Candidatus Pacebacteria bacterium]|nr:16S rRNA (cytosine(1402)-N(4))-methyltransferase RsmH [Candidatus Paceibacterota bacterium]